MSFLVVQAWLWAIPPRPLFCYGWKEMLNKCSPQELDNCSTGSPKYIESRHKIPWLYATSDFRLIYTKMKMFTHRRSLSSGQQHLLSIKRFYNSGWFIYYYYYFPDDLKTALEPYKHLRLSEKKNKLNPQSPTGIKVERNLLVLWQKQQLG